MNKEEFLKKYKISESFLNYAINIGILRNDFSFDDLLNILVVFKNGKPYTINGEYIIKKNRLPLIGKFIEIQKQNPTPKQQLTIEIPKGEKNRFTFKKLGDNKLKLVKL